MWQKCSHSLGWGVVLSVLLHLCFLVWVFRYLRLEPQGAGLSTPVRVVIAAPALPAGPALGGEQHVPTLPPVSLRPARPNRIPPTPTPFMTAMATPLPTPPSASAPPPVARNIAPQYSPLASVAALVQVPALSTFVALPPVSSPAPTMPSEAPLSVPSPTVTRMPAPRASVTSALPTIPPPHGPDARATQVLMTVPHPNIARRSLPPPPAIAHISLSRLAPAPAPDTPVATAGVIPITPAPVKRPPLPPAPAIRPRPVDMPRLAPPPIDTLLPAPSVPSHYVASVHQTPPASLPKIPSTTSTPASRSLPPPATMTVLPPSHSPTRRVPSNQHREAAATPELARPASGPSLRSKSGTPQHAPLASGQPASKTSPRFASKPCPKYPYIARQRRSEGTVILEFEALANGKIGSIRVTKSSGDSLLDTAAKKAVKHWRPIPETFNGAQSTWLFKVPFRFRLNTSHHFNRHDSTISPADMTFINCDGK